MKWIASFLTERQQRVRYKGCLSNWETLSGGVPQGTKLGPVIFLACVNNALDCSHNKCWKYVDDLTLGETRLINKSSNLQADLNQLDEWSKNNGFSLNPIKCKAFQIYFGKKSVLDTSYYVSNVQLPIVSSVKLLGITLQSNLKWNSHITEIIKKVNKKLFMLRKLKVTGLNTDELIIIYKGYIRPVMEYAAPVWHSSLTLAQSDKLELTQKRVCRIALGTRYANYKQALLDLKLESLYERRLNLCSKFILKTYKSNKFTDWFPKSNRCHAMTLRSTRLFHKHHGATNRFKNSPIPFLTGMLNSILND